MRKAWLALSLAVLSGCGVPKQEPVRRVETHEIQPDGGARVTISVAEKSAYNFSFGDYSAPVDPSFRPTKVFRMVNGEKKVALNFTRKQRRKGAEVLVRLDRPWAPGTKLELQIEGRMPAVHPESAQQAYSFTVPGFPRADYQSASGQTVSYFAQVAVPAGMDVTSATKGYRVSPATATSGVVRYVWEGRLAPGKVARFDISYLPIAQRGGCQ